MVSGSSILFCLTFLSASFPIFGYNILMFCPLPTKSHYILCIGVANVLVDRGHEVTLISAFQTDNPKLRDLSVPQIQTLKDTHMPGFGLNKMSIFEILRTLSSFQKDVYEKVFSDIEIQKMLSDKSQKFDAVILEYFMNDMAIGFGVKYDCPVISLSPTGFIHQLAVLTNNPLSLATVPNISTSFTGNMNLWERVLNFLSTVMLDLLSLFYIHPLQSSFYEKYFPEESKKVSYNELVTRTSGVLVNSHPSIGIVRPLLPNAVDIAGYHIKDPEPLPQDLKQILDSAKNGVIYFNMGSILKSSEMSPEMKSLFLKSLSNLKQTVLWKYEENFPNAPKNLIIRKWMPQTGILAHPNTKLFITHGGFLSRTEAAHFGVPLLSIPIFADQHHNAKCVQERGNGVYLAFTNVTDQSFEWALNEALQNPSYYQTAKEVQRLYHDRPIKADDLLGFHVEQIVRSKGGKHLTPAPLSRCSHMLLDVIAVVSIPIFALSGLLTCVVWKCCCGKRKEEKKSEKKEKKQ